LIAALRDVLAGPAIEEAFARSFERRVAEQRRETKGDDTERRLAAARRRLTNATRLLVEMPDDEALRAQRAGDLAEVRRLEIALAGASGKAERQPPSSTAMRRAIGAVLDAMASDDTGRARAALTRILSPLLVTRRNYGHEVTGSIALVSVSGSSGGRRSQSLYLISNRIFKRRGFIQKPEK
jgi:hypothetical protein